MKNAIILLLLVGLCGCFGREPEKTVLKGKSMPSFNLLLADSITHLNTISIPAGKPIVLFYFGPNCPYSRAQMDEIIENMPSLKDIQFYIFTTAPFPEMKGFYDHYQLRKYPNMAVGLDYDNFFSDYFKAIGVPYMAIYGRDKRLNEAFVGKVGGSQIKEIAEK
ncbi:hypothetical protein CLV51_104399 [Chitinophaga niastensis]|uniref:Thioredoxin domain-containing protein n=1 Tax=Chitinophaga niastensis TaxID=536980 RepID=A0A2P8HHI5_CHINA|nr:hypothetical protein [Chitinophaga niastensis]PSL45692.1 hypothetical protein CLV51_104399 [Chitinophaga niastensis]